MHSLNHLHTKHRAVVELVLAGQQLPCCKLQVWEGCGTAIVYECRSLTQVVSRHCMRCTLCMYASLARGCACTSVCI